MFFIIFLKKPKIAKNNENKKKCIFDIFASLLAFSTSSQKNLASSSYSSSDGPSPCSSVVFFSQSQRANSATATPQRPQTHGLHCQPQQRLLQPVATQAQERPSRQQPFGRTAERLKQRRRGNKKEKELPREKQIRKQ